MIVVTADLWDDFADELELFNVAFNPFGLKDNFSGQVATVKVFEDNSLVRKLLSENGKGKVLVIDGGGSRRCALMGDNMAKLAMDNEWEGVVVYGCIRDSKVINQMEVGILALGTCPVKSVKRNEGQIGIELIIQGTKINEQQFIYVDSDGIVLANRKLV